MDGLVDLDELALRCRDDHARRYIKEAVACYKAGAFRSCIVSTWNAIVFDFLHKLHELEMTGDKNAHKHLKEFAAIRTGGESKLKEALDFERNVLDLATTEFELLTPLEREDLERLQADRNRCAHPSMQSPEDPYQPRAELARAHLRNAVEIMLEREPVQGKVAMARLFSEVGSEYFPRSVDDAQVIFANGPLGRPRKSLVRNFALATLKSLLNDKLTDRQFDQRCAAFGATLQMHREGVEHMLRDKLSNLIALLDDPQMSRGTQVIGRMPILAEFLRDDAQVRLRGYVTAMPTDDLGEAFPAVLELTCVQDEVTARIEAFTSMDVFAVLVGLGEDIPPAIVERILELYEKSDSYDTANNRGQLVRKVLHTLSEEQVECVFRATENSQVSGSFGLPNVLSAIKESGKLSEERFDELMHEHALAGSFGHLLFEDEKEADDGGADSDDHTATPA